MKKNKKSFLLLMFILFIFSVVYTYFFREIVDDELYNYGFAKSILDGRIPYVDFNMIIPPVFPYLVSIFLKLFGCKLIVYHIFIAALCVGCVWTSYSKIGFKAICLYFFVLIYPFTGYNTFCLFLMMLLLFFDGKLGEKYDVVEAIIISLMFMSKQTFGLLILPSLIYSKHKKKSIAIYLISFLLILLYLVCHHSFYQFIDYCFLGMFEFGSMNGEFSFLLIVELFIILFLLVLFIRNRKKEYFYIMCFQIIAFPAVNYVHFVIAFVPVLYLLFLHFEKRVFVNLFLVSFSIIFFIIFSLGSILSDGRYLHIEHYKANNFMKGRLVQSATYYYVDHIKEQLNLYSDYHSYILGNFSYLVKLNLELPLNKYDIINHGNMGFDGEAKYINEIDHFCKKNKCMFVISDEEAREKIYNQVDVTILKYVQENYFQVYSSSIFSVYISKN